MATIAVGTAHAQLIQTQATNGLALGGKGDYTHAGSLGSGSSASTPLSAAATAAGAGPLNGENIQGGLTLSSPSTSLGLTAQHSIMEVAPSDQVSSVSLSASQTVFLTTYPGGRAAAAVQQADYTYRAAQVASRGLVEGRARAPGTLTRS